MRSERPFTLGSGVARALLSLMPNTEAAADESSDRADGSAAVRVVLRPLGPFEVGVAARARSEFDPSNSASFAAIDLDAPPDDDDDSAR